MDGCPRRRMPPGRRARGSERRLPFNAPVRAWTMAEWALLPLRLFLGATLHLRRAAEAGQPELLQRAESDLHPGPTDRGLAHESDPRPARPLDQSRQADRTRHRVLARSRSASACLLGLWTRIAAIGGAVLSLSLFLTVSFHASPYFTGADIVFFFAWIPFIVAGGGTRLSARRVDRPTSRDGRGCRRRPNWWRFPSPPCSDLRQLPRRGVRRARRTGL